MSSYNKELTNFFMSNEKEKLRFMSGVIYAINKIPSLLNDRQSLFNAVLELAQIGISPGITQEAYILPFKGKATAMIGYQGYVSILYRAGITAIYAETVRKNDVFKNIMGSDPRIEHEINPSHSIAERWESIGCYVVVKFNGEKVHKFMTKEEILKFRVFSQSYKANDNSSSPWNEKNDPELNMWKKTVLKQIIKYLPKNEIIAKAIEVDNIEAPVAQGNKKDVVIWGSEDVKKAQEIFENLELNQKTTDGN